MKFSEDAVLCDAASQDIFERFSIPPVPRRTVLFTLRTNWLCNLRNYVNSHEYVIFVVVQSLSCVWLFATLWTSANQASRPSPSPRVCSNSCPLSPWCHLTISSCYPLLLCHLLLFLPWIFPSIRVFSSELALHVRWPKYWSFSISPSNEYSGLISFRIEWFDLLALQGTLESLLQSHNLKVLVLWCLAFFMVQLLHRYITTEKITALTIQTFVSAV